VNATAGGPEKRSEPRIDKLFKIMVRQQASDMHLKFQQPPILRIRGLLQVLKSEPLNDRQIEGLVFELLGEEQINVFKQLGSLDFAHEFDDGWRVRINVYRQRGHTSVSCRLVQRVIPTFEELHLPGTLRRIAEYPTGLVLVVGATGTGKSTTLAAMIQHINETRRCHILTIEDPIEYAYKDGKSFVDQREIGLDVGSWSEALKYAMREDPDVILVGEMRDPDTFHAGMTAAETGHLVFGTLHASDCSQVIGRILEMFPQEQHHMLRRGLAMNLRAVVSQLLLPSCKEGVNRVPAVEVLICTPIVKSLLLRGEENKLPEVIRGGKQEGMQTVTQAIADLVNKDLVLRKVALDMAPNRDRLNMALRGIDIGAGKIIG